MTLNGNGNGTWTKIVLSLIVPTVLAVGAFFTLKADVGNLERTAATHAVKESVEIQYEAIRRELEDIKQLLRAR